MNEVAKRMKISRCCVQQIIKKHKSTGIVINRPRAGRPREFSDRQDLELVQMSLRQRKTTVPELRCEWTMVSGVSVSTQTVRRRLLEKGLRGCVAAKKPKYAPQHTVRTPIQLNPHTIVYILRLPNWLGAPLVTHRFAPIYTRKKVTVVLWYSNPYAPNAHMTETDIPHKIASTTAH